MNRYKVTVWYEDINGEISKPIIREGLAIGPHTFKQELAHEYHERSYVELVFFGPISLMRDKDENGKRKGAK